MSSCEEEWRPIVAPGFEGLYEVSNLGRVRSFPRTITRSDGRVLNLKGRILSPGRSKSGHLSVVLCSDCVQKSHSVHALVLTAFVGPRPEGMEACHADGDPANNAIDNLRWDTRAANNHDRVRHGTHHSANKTHCPRDHSLVSPNLVPSVLKDGRRKCLACERARKAGRKAAKAGRAFDFQSVADEKYRLIMGLTEAEDVA